jgi:AhpD family alkylhydroperoxidase
MTTNYERAFEPRPEVYAAWASLNTAIKDGMDLRLYELATLAAARRLRPSYCALAHGKTLDALGVLADASYRKLEPELREALVVGRPIAEE